MLTLVGSIKKWDIPLWLEERYKSLLALNTLMLSKWLFFLSNNLNFYIFLFNQPLIIELFQKNCRSISILDRKSGRPAHSHRSGRAQRLPAGAGRVRALQSHRHALGQGAGWWWRWGDWNGLRWWSRSRRPQARQVPAHSRVQVCLGSSATEENKRKVCQKFWRTES